MLVPRLGRITLNAFTVLSLLLCAATLALWVRSCRFTSERRIQYRGEYCRIVLARGALTIDNAPQRQLFDQLTRSLQQLQNLGIKYAVEVDELGARSDLRPHHDAEAKRALSLLTEIIAQEARSRQRLASMTWRPPWSHSTPFALPVIVLLTGAMPLAWVSRRRTRIRRIRRGLCPTCGYDLRATPEDQSRYPLNYASRIGADRGH